MEVERERVEVEEEGERKGLRRKKPRPWAVAVHHGLWDAPQANRGGCLHKKFSDV